MGRHRIITVIALLLALGLVGAACSDDDGADVRSTGDCAAGSAGASGSGSRAGSASASGPASDSASASCPSGSGSGSGNASGSGIASEVEGSSTDDPLVTQAVAEYKTWVLAQVDETIAATTTFTDAVRSGDVEGAKAAYAPSRQGWERIEPIAGLVEEIDGAVDARVALAAAVTAT